MKAVITYLGQLEIRTESELETYALMKWKDDLDDKNFTEKLNYMFHLDNPRSKEQYLNNKDIK